MPAVTLDLWHTLIQLSPVAEDDYLAWQVETLASLLEDSPRAPAPAGGPVSPVEAAHAALDSANRRTGLGAPVRALAEDAAQRAGRRLSPEPWVATVESKVEALPFEPVPGAGDALARLRASGYRTAIVSNLVGETGRSMRRVLARLGLDRGVETCVFSEELPWAKPAPEIFWEALRRLGTPPSEAAHIGDLAADVLGARAAGFRGALLFVGARRYGPRYAELCGVEAPIAPQPDVVVEAWEELPVALDAVFGPRR